MVLCSSVPPLLNPHVPPNLQFPLHSFFFVVLPNSPYTIWSLHSPFSLTIFSYPLNILSSTLKIPIMLQTNDYINRLQDYGIMPLFTPALCLIKTPLINFNPMMENGTRVNQVGPWFVMVKPIIVLWNESWFHSPKWIIIWDMFKSRVHPIIFDCFIECNATYQTFTFFFSDWVWVGALPFTPTGVPKRRGGIQCCRGERKRESRWNRYVLILLCDG